MVKANVERHFKRKGHGDHGRIAAREVRGGLKSASWLLHQTGNRPPSSPAPPGASAIGAHAPRRRPKSGIVWVVRMDGVAIREGTCNGKRQTTTKQRLYRVNGRIVYRSEALRV